MLQLLPQLPLQQLPLQRLWPGRDIAEEFYIAQMCHQGCRALHAGARPEGSHR